MIGKQIKVIGDDGEKIVYNRENLESVLVKCRSHPIAIIAVAGMFREGKSFLLNMFLRYLHRATNSSYVPAERVTGFEAKGGCARVTQGMSFWSEPFIVDNGNATKVAIVLCDSQGLFDNETASMINSFIFGFSAVIPSLLIYNAKDHIAESTLDNLAVSFQHVKFLIRDWNDEEKYSLGSDGGTQYVNKILEVTNIGQLNNTRKVIRNHFPSISGFLLPPPGTHVERSKSNDIEISRVDELFLLELDQLCQIIFHDDIQIKKNRKGEFMSSDEIIAFTTYLVKKFQDGQIDDPGTHWESESKAVCENAKSKSSWVYKQWVSELLVKEKDRSHCSYVSKEFLQNSHSTTKMKATKEFKETTNIYPHSDEFPQTLEDEVEKVFKDIERENNEIEMRVKAETEREEALERERLLKIEQGKNEKAKIELEKKHRRMMEELDARRKRELAEQQASHGRVIQEHRVILER